MQTAVQQSETRVIRGNFAAPRPSLISNQAWPFEHYEPAILALVDLLSGVIAILATIAILPDNANTPLFLLVTPLVGMVVLYLAGGYDRRTDLLALGFVSQFLITMVIGAALSMLLAYVFSTFNQAVKPSRAFIPMLYAVFAVIALLLRRKVGGYVQRQLLTRKILVLGAGLEAKRFLREYKGYGEKWRLEFVDPSGKLEGAPLEGFGSPIVTGGAEEKLARIDESYAAVIIASNTREFSETVLNRLISLHCSHIPVLTIEAFREQQWYRVSARAIKPESLFQSEFRPARGSAYCHFKRIADVAFSLLALVFLSPVLLLAALLIKIESRGSVLFKQMRIGRNGQPFLMYKLRTMRENSGDMYTRTGDSRITRLGRWLRLTHLDELPQLWNVLRGEMSLIGPRAEWDKCVEIYEKEIPHYHLRHLVPPGITGWAQVKFKYGESKSDAIEKFEFDLYYIQNFSLQLDLCIVLKTLHTMLTGNGR